MHLMKRKSLKLTGTYSTDVSQAVVSCPIEILNHFIRLQIDLKIVFIFLEDLITVTILLF